MQDPALIAELLSRLPEHMPRNLTEAEFAQFQRDGVIMLKSVFSKQWIERTASAVDQVVRRPTFVGWFLGIAEGFNHEANLFAIPVLSSFLSIRCAFSATQAFLWQINDDVRDLVWYSPAARLAQALMR